MTAPQFSTLEAARSEYRAKMTVKDGFTAEQQIAISMLHNVDVTGGCHMSIAVVIPKPTLKALVGKGIIDEKARLTKLGNDTLRKWIKDSKLKHPLRVF